jgi:PAS domain S-box-containing protein/diguanylate cyclase (GGDEF)-like protein
MTMAQDITEQKQLLEELRREKEDLSALIAVTTNGISTLHLKELLDVLLQRIVAVMRADAAVILLKKDNQLYARSSLGIDAESRLSYVIPIGEGFAGTIAATRQPLYIEDAQTDSRLIAFKPGNIRSILGVPLQRQGELVGVLHVGWKSIHPQSDCPRGTTQGDRELHLLEITAERCTMAILNAQLYERTKQLQERLQLQINHMPIACMVSDHQLCVTDWNPAAEKIFGFSKHEALGQKLCELIAPVAVRPHLETSFRQLVAGEKTVHSINESLTQDGRIIICEWYHTPVKEADGIVVAMLSMAQDITERQQTEAQLWRYAYYDALTDLPNRALFSERLEQRIEASKQEQGGLFAVLLLKLEHFEMVKYSLGHNVADQLIIATARRLEAHLQPSATLARVGTDEFAILLTELKNNHEATDRADCIHRLLILPFDLQGREVFSTSSIGIALGGTEEFQCIVSLPEFLPNSSPERPHPSSSSEELTCSEQPEDFLRAADTARHHAKVQAHVSHAVFNPAMHEQAVARFQLETDLRRAIERQPFQVHYQPIVSLEMGKITGFEALVRWIHPTRGMVSPMEFIPLAEETGLISFIDWWVLREACTQLRVWQQVFAEDSASLTMSVNFSGLHLVQLGLLERLDQVLRETGVEGCNLKLEITESGLLKNATSGTEILQELKTLGVKLSIDDFGTGYSSLARLHQLPIDTLKIDRSFVSRMGHEGESLEIIRAIMMLAHSLEMDVIAEGVETPEQLSRLRSLNCEYGQGYFFSRPVDSKRAEELLAAQLQW